MSEQRDRAPVPAELRTPRFLLRPWRSSDAEQLLAVLEANTAHLGDWIPKRISEPAPVPDLRVRLEGFAADFEAGREWRFGIFSVDGESILGEVSLFPRDGHDRVPYGSADRVEIGYWLRADHTGRGIATECARLMLDIAAALPGIHCVEIRCDARNAPSAAVPRRLEFQLAEASADSELMVWCLDLQPKKTPGPAPG